MEPKTARLLAAGLALLAVIFGIVAAATNGWMRYSASGLVGTFGLTGSVVCVDSGSSGNSVCTSSKYTSDYSKKSSADAALAFTILGVLSSSGVFSGVLVHVMECSSRFIGVTFGLSIFGFLCCLLAVFIFPLTVGKDLCSTVESLPGVSCSVDYAFYLEIVATLCLAAAAYLIKTSSADYKSL